MPVHRRSWLFYRNAMLAWGSVLFIIGASLATPTNLANLAWLLPACFLAYLVMGTFFSVHPPRFPGLMQITPDTEGMVYDRVEFRSRDGVNLSGFFITGARRTPLILVHGRGGTGGSLILHISSLAKNGFGILVFDLRAHGRSQGDRSTFGILEAQDVLGAVDYLHTRSDVEPQRTGVLGISLGAQGALRAAVASESIRAVVLEGMGPMTLEDHGGRPTSLIRWINYPINWLVYNLGNYMAGIPAPESTSSILARLHQPVLIISAGKGTEQYFNRRFFDAANEPKKLWEIPEASHAGGLFAKHKEYQDCVSQFFENFL